VPRYGVILRITDVAFAVKATDPDGDPLTFMWDFDDGNTQAGGPGISHVFDQLGSMNVTARVDDGRGGKASVTTTINVGTVTGNYTGVLLSDSNGGGVRLTGSVTQTGRRFDGSWSLLTGGGTSRDVIVRGVLSDPKEMTFTVVALCGEGDAVYRGSFSDDLTFFVGEGPGCSGAATLRRIEFMKR
jgi:hypothetical protein